MLETNIPMNIPKSRTKYRAVEIKPEPIEEELEHCSVFRDKVKEYEHRFAYDSSPGPSKLFKNVKW